MRSLVLDANTIIQYFDDSHKGHLAAVQAIGRTKHPLLVNDLTLAEVLVGAFREDRPSERLDDIKNKIGATIVGETGEEWAMYLAELRARVVPRLKVPDAVVLATALRVDGLVCTFDTALREAARNEGVLYVPTK